MRCLGWVKLVSGMLLLFGSFCGVQAQERLSNEDIEEIAQRVVQIVALDRRGDAFASGTGTIVSADGLIFTNRHVIEDGSDYAILLLEDINEPPVFRYYASLVKVAEADEWDFAILQIDRDENGDPIRKNTLELPFLDPATHVPDAPVRGDTLYIFGFPGIGEGYLTVVTGDIVSVRNGEVADAKMPVFIQTDAEIAPGNSGGLAVNVAGDPVGIPTSVLSESETGGRFGGILPFQALLALLDAGEGLRDYTNNLPNMSSSSSSGTGAPDVSIDCDDGIAIEDGFSLTLLQTPTDAEYTVTVLGLDDTDPNLVILYPNGSDGYCSDDNRSARRYSLDLPEIGQIEGDTRGAQIEFTQDKTRPQDMEVIVGNGDGTPGRYAIIIEGMELTRSTESIAAFSLRLTRGLVRSNQDVAVFMLGMTSRLDPVMLALNADAEEAFEIEGKPLVCDDAGNRENCFLTSTRYSLDNASVITARETINGDEFDAALIFPVGELVTKQEDLPFLLSSVDNSTGEFVLVIVVELR